MDAVMMQLSEAVSDERGTFHALVKARERNDGRWEGWLEFVAPAEDSCRYATPIETRQHDRVTMERWASGVTVVYAEGALARARTVCDTAAESDHLLALQELIEALDRRVPHVERAGEVKIADDARRLRAAATARIAIVRKRGADEPPRGGHPEEERRDKRGDDTTGPGRPNDEVPANRREDPRNEGRDQDTERKDRRSSS